MLEKKPEIKKLAAAFSLLSPPEKERFMAMVIQDIKSNRYLLGKVCRMAEQAYHPLAEIEAWMEGRFVRHPTYPPKRVIDECLRIKKLPLQMQPLLWLLARKVKKRVNRRIERKAKENV